MNHTPDVVESMNFGQSCVPLLRQSTNGDGVLTGFVFEQKILCVLVST